MQLEQLQQEWQRLNQKLDQSLALQAEMVRQVVMRPARRRVNRLAIWPAIDLVFCAVGLLLVGSFLGDHWRDWRLAAPAIAVMISAGALAAASVLQLVRVAELDWCGPVAEIQTALERLRAVKIRQFKWTILFSPLVGFCALMVGLPWLFEWLSNDRVNILDKLDQRWVVANYLFGVLFVPLGYYVARYLAERCHRQQWWKATLDDISGKSLKAVTRDVERWANLQPQASTPST
jgi:hypothetical protein